MKFPLKIHTGEFHHGRYFDHQDYHVEDPDGHSLFSAISGNDAEAPDFPEAAEIVRRCNAFDELLAFVRITYNCDFGRNINETALNLLTKYEVPGSEPSA